MAQRLSIGALQHECEGIGGWSGESRQAEGWPSLPSIFSVMDIRSVLPRILAVLRSGLKLLYGGPKGYRCEYNYPNVRGCNLRGHPRLGADVLVRATVLQAYARMGRMPKSFRAVEFNVRV